MAAPTRRLPLHLFLFAAAAQRGPRRARPQMPRFLNHARALAGALLRCQESRSSHLLYTPLFHVHLRGDRDALRERRSTWRRSGGSGNVHRLEPSVVASSNKLELNVGEPTLDTRRGGCRAPSPRLFCLTRRHGATRAQRSQPHSRRCRELAETWRLAEATLVRRLPGSPTGQVLFWSSDYAPPTCAYRRPLAAASQKRRTTSLHRVRQRVFDDP